MQLEQNLGSADDVRFYIHSQGSLVLETLEKSANVQLTVVEVKSMSNTVIEK